MKMKRIVLLSMLPWLFISCSKHESTPVKTTTVYAAGYQTDGSNRIAKYWKNGSSVNLDDGSKMESVTGMVVVSP